MKCYNEGEFGDYSDEVACAPSVPMEALQWLGVALAALVVLFVALWVLGQIRDWFSARYGRDQDDTTTAVASTQGPHL